MALNALGALRLHIISVLGLKPEKKFDAHWVVDFPLFEQDDQGNITSSHHPFTAPKAEDMDRIVSDPLSVTSEAYDFVMNGTELGSGSVRIHNQETQRLIFETLKLDKQSIDDRFGFFPQSPAIRYTTTCRHCPWHRSPRRLARWHTIHPRRHRLPQNPKRQLPHERSPLHRYPRPTKRTPPQIGDGGSIVQAAT